MQRLLVGAFERKSSQLQLRVESLKGLMPPNAHKTKKGEREMVHEKITWTEICCLQLDQAHPNFIGQ